MLEAPLAKDDAPITGLIADLAELGTRVRRQHDVVPVVARFDFARQAHEFWIRLRATGAMQRLRGDLIGLSQAPARRIARRRQRIADLTGREAELGREFPEIDLVDTVSRWDLPLPVQESRGVIGYIGL